ncbi:MAG: RNA polymerase factor sigma-54 [Candidatus Omnitrophica bacterium]|nr:RNA polymerase factor sigma-54 [Candidatus Omnitrophota bacterium]
MSLRAETSQIQTQRLVLSPQIRQFLRLLQMPVIELKEAIDQELSSNPALEEAATDPSEDAASGDTSVPDKPLENSKTTAEDLKLQEKLDNLARLEEDYDPYSYRLNDLDSESREETDRKSSYRQMLITKPTTLIDHLTWQKMHLDLSEEDDKIANFIIGNINEDGYLTASLEEIAHETNATVSDAKSVLKLIQQFDPPGVAATSLAECLVLQLNGLGKNAGLPIRMITECLPLLERRKYSQIARQLGVGEQSVQAAVKLIGTLEPKPGRSFYQEEHITVVPDLRIVKDEEANTYRAELIDEDFPRLRISPGYRRMLRDKNLDKKTKEYLRERIHSGLWFMNAMEQRRSTLKKIADAITEIQSEYMEHGPSRLKPLRMKDIASKIGIHESTVSRAIQGKYMETPHNTVPLKSFFSSSVATDNGSEESQKSTLERIRKLIESENPLKPLSDQQLVARLKGDGIRVARRTAAKYRDLLKILPSHLRRRDAAA